MTDKPASLIPAPQGYTDWLAELKGCIHTESPATDQLDVLALLIEQYEREYFPIADPDPIDFLEHVMEVRGLTRKGLEESTNQAMVQPVTNTFCSMFDPN